MGNSSPLLITHSDTIEIVKVGTITFSLPANESRRRAILAERLGFDSFFVTDHMIDLTEGTYVDPWTTIGGIAVATRRIALGASVTDGIRAHPSKTAQMLLTLNEMSGGRVILGIGAGEAMNLLPFGLPFDSPSDRAARLEEAVRVIKLLWSASRKRPVSFSGRFYRLDSAWLDQQVKPPPLYVGAFGARRTLEIVGRHADGWLPWLNTPETYAERVRVIKEAAKNAGRDPESLAYIAPMYTHMGNDPKSVRETVDLTKREILIEGNTARKLGFSPPKGLRDTYQTTRGGEKVNAMLDTMQDSVSDELALRFLALGSADDWIERMERFKKAGATHVLAQFLDQSEASMKAFANRILPRIERGIT